MRWLGSLVGVVVIVVAFSLVARAMGFHVSLWLSLAASLLLTLVLNAILGAFRTRRG